MLKILTALERVVCASSREKHKNRPPARCEVREVTRLVPNGEEKWGRVLATPKTCFLRGVGGEIFLVDEIVKTPELAIHDRYRDNKDMGYCLMHRSIQISYQFAWGRRIGEVDFSPPHPQPL